MKPPPPRTTLFPYTTLFRSHWRDERAPTIRSGALEPHGRRSACSRAGSCRACPPKRRDRKSTRLNSSHSQISYAVFCLKKKNISIHISVTHHYTTSNNSLII